MKIKEEQPAMNADAISSMPLPLDNTQHKNWKMFTVKADVFKKFQSGRQPFERWSKFLDINDQSQNEIYEYVKKFSKNTVVLRCEETGALRAIRRKSSN